MKKERKKTRKIFMILALAALALAAWVSRGDFKTPTHQRPKIDEQKAKIEQEEFDRFIKRSIAQKIQKAGYKYKESQIKRVALVQQRPRLYMVNVDLGSKGTDILGVLILSDHTKVLPWIEAHQMWQSLRHQ